MKEKESVEKAYMRRLVKSKEGLNNELIDLAMKSKYMIDEFKESGDNTNAIAALKATADIFMKFAKIEGLSNDIPEVNINVQMDKIVKNITNKSKNMSSRLKNMIDDDEEEPIEAEYTIKDD